MARPYPRQHSNTWYLGRRPYRIFMLREWSATFVALYVVLLLVLAGKVRDGEAAFDAYVEDVLQHPLLIAVHAVMLLFALLHTVTWFSAMPKGLRLRRGEQEVPPVLVIGANYAAWVMVSVIVALLFVAA